MLKDFNNYIVENISDVNKEYTNKIYQLFVEQGYGTYIVNFNNSRLKLMNVKITFKKNENKKCYFDDKNASLKDFFGMKVLSDVYLYFGGFNIKELKANISHEINHIQEYYDKLIVRKNKSIHNILNHTIQQFRNKNKYFDVFIDIIYNTTDDELNNKINEIYFYLNNLNSIRKLELQKSLNNCNVYNKIKEIENLNFEKLSYGLINKIGEKEMINLINEFNKLFLLELKIQEKRNTKTYKFLKKKIFNNNDIVDYFNIWENVIKNKFDKWHYKIDKIINQVIFDKNSNERYINVNIDDDLINRINEII